MLEKKEFQKPVNPGIQAFAVTSHEPIPLLLPLCSWTIPLYCPNPFRHTITQPL